MNKKLWALILPLGLGVGFVGAAAATGRAITDKLAEHSARVRLMLPKGAFEEQVDRGIFSTTRTLTFHVGCPPRGAADSSAARAPLTFRWRDVIQHGPLPAFSSAGLAQIDSKLELPKALGDHLQAEGGGKWQLVAHTRIGFGGELESKFSAPAAKLAADSDAINFSAFEAKLTGHVPFGAGPLTYKASFSPFDLQQTSHDSAFHVTLGRFDLQGQMQLDPAKPGMFMPMKGHGRMTHVLMRGSAPSSAGGMPSELALGLNDVGFTHAVEQDKGLWSMQTSLRASSEILGFKLDKLEMNVAFNHLHEPSYMKLVTEAMAMSSRCEANAPEPDPGEMLDKLQDDLLTFMSHDPEYSVGPLAVEIGGKRAELSYRLGVKGVSAQDKDQPLPALLLSKSVGHAEAAMDLALVDLVAQRVLGPAGLQPASAQPSASSANNMATAIMARAMIEGFVSEGYLTRDGDKVRATLDTAGENVMLNGKPFSVSDLLGADDPGAAADAEPDATP